jgi:cysteine-rich repeat protein
MAARSFPWLALFLAAVPVQSLAADTLVNTCGQAFAGNGFLAADLDCTGFAGDAVTLGGGTLDLRGFTLTGGQQNGVECTASCTIVSDPAGGTITGSQGAGVSLTLPGAVLTITDVTIGGNTQNGVDGPGSGVVKVFRATITGNAKSGILAHAKRVLVYDSTISSNGETGVYDGVASSSTMSVKNSMVTDNGWNGIGGGKTKVQDSQVMNNGMALTSAAIYARGGIRLIRSTVSGNMGGIAVHSADAHSTANIMDSDVLSNTGHGVVAEGIATLKLKRSTVSGNTGNGLDAGGKAILIDSTVSSNGETGAFAGRQVRAVRSTLNNNKRGAHVYANTNTAGKISLTDATVTGNTRDGIVAEDAFSTASITAVRSNVTGNGTDPACNIAPVVCADVVSESEIPKFELVPGTYECNTSFVLGTGYLPCPDCPGGLFPGLAFGVCLQDCQDGALDGAEVCDDGGFSATCDNNCTPPACGDLTTNPAAGEECDDGDLDENDACKNDCTLNVCGDGVIRTGVEECDDGNTTSGDGCSSTCQNEP